MKFGDLRVDIDRQPGGILRFDWRGKSNEREPETVLKPFLNGLVRQAQQERVTLEMHFEELEFFNSSTITVLIQFVKEVKAQQVRLRLSYNPEHKWQRIFFDALWMFEKPDGLIKIQPAKSEPHGRG